MKKAVGSAIALALVLAGCGSKTDPNEKNFGDAIAKYLDKRGDLCVNDAVWPVDVNAFEMSMMRSLPNGLANRMAVLEVIGLAKSEDVERESVSLTGQPTGRTYKVKSYSLTEASKPYQRERKVDKTTAIELCWGRKVLAEVVKWEGPMKLGDYQEARVHYHYKIDALADWATKPELASAYPEIQHYIEDAGTKVQAHGVKLTSEGWEPLGMDWNVVLAPRR